MLLYHYETDFNLSDEAKYTAWLHDVITSEAYKVGDINYIFCDDEYLHKINVKFLDHDTYTDIISFDDTIGKLINGDIYISVERVTDNAKSFDVSFDNELLRVMVHGLLHFCGYKDKSEEEAAMMRNKEDEKTKLFHVERKN